MGEDGKFTHMNSFSRNEIDGVIFVVTYVMAVSKLLFFFYCNPITYTGTLDFCFNKTNKDLQFRKTQTSTL